MLNGWVTYIAAAVAVVLTGLQAANVIDSATYDHAMALIGATAAFGLRRAISTTNDKNIQAIVERLAMMQPANKAPRPSPPPLD